MKISWEQVDEGGQVAVMALADDIENPAPGEAVKVMAVALTIAEKVDQTPGVQLCAVSGEPGVRFVVVALDMTPDRFEAEVMPGLVDAAREHVRWLTELGVIDE